jgi:hypothetical protein
LSGDDVELKTPQALVTGDERETVRDQVVLDGLLCPRAGLPEWRMR